MAKEGDTLAQIVGAEAVLSRQHTQDPNPKVHVQTISTEPEAISGEPGAIKEVAHEHNGHAEPDLQEQPGDLNANTPKGVAHPEPDLMPGEDIDPNVNAPVHLEGTGPGVLMDAEEDRPEDMLEEDGITRENASVKEDRVPHIELQESGVSHLATPEEDMFLTLSSSSPPTTSDAARAWRSLAVNTGTLAIPILDQGAVLEPLPHDMPVPNKGVESPDHHPSEQSQAPTEVRGPLESLLGEASQCAMGQMVLTSARALEGKTPIGEAHGCPPDLPDPQTQGSTAWEPAFVVLKACVHMHKVRRPVPDKGARTRPDPWPSLGIIIVDLDTCIGSASQLEGEQNFHLPCVGSKLHAAPSPPQNFPSSFSPFLPPNTLTRENPLCGEGTATERHVIEDHPGPEPLKPPDLQAKDLEEAGGALSALGNVPVILEGPDPLGLAGAVVNADADEVEPPGSDVYKRGGVLPVAGAAPALAEGTASVEPAGKADRAMAARSKALAPPMQGKAWREVEMPLREGKGEPDALPQALPGKRKLGPPEAPPQRGRHNSKVLPPDGERECGTTPQGNPNEGDCEPSWPLRELSHKAMPSTWEGAAPWDPGGRLPRERTLNSKGPVEAMDIAPGIDAPQHNDTAGIDAHKKTQKNLAARRVSQRRHYQHQKQSRTCTHPPSSHPTVEGSIRFLF